MSILSELTLEHQLQNYIRNTYYMNIEKRSCYIKLCKNVAEKYI